MNWYKKLAQNIDKKPWELTEPTGVLPFGLHNAKEIITKLPGLTPVQTLWLDISLHKTSNLAAKISPTRKSWIEILQRDVEAKMPLLSALQKNMLLSKQEIIPIIKILLDSKKIHDFYASGEYRSSGLRGTRQWNLAWSNKYTDILKSLSQQYSFPITNLKEEKNELV